MTALRLLHRLVLATLLSASFYSVAAADPVLLNDGDTVTYENGVDAHTTSYAFANEDGGYAYFDVSSPDVSATQSGALSGNGQLWKTGAGALTLSDTSTYTGQIIIQSGTLILSGNDSGTHGQVYIGLDESVASLVLTGTGINWTQDYAQPSITAHSTLTLAGGARLETDGGGGGVHNTFTVTGPGTTWTTGHYGSFNLGYGYDHDGNTLTISDGGTVFVGSRLEFGNYASTEPNSVIVTGTGSTLQVGTELIADGGVTVSEGAILKLGDLDAVGYSGSSFGPGSFGPSSTTPSVTLNNGTLLAVNGDVQGNYLRIDGTTSVIDTNGFNISIQNLEGPGVLTKNGTGTLSLGAHTETPFTGSIIVNAGRLNPFGNITSAITVNSGATLGRGVYDGAVIFKSGSRFEANDDDYSYAYPTGATFSAGLTLEANAELLFLYADFTNLSPEYTYYSTDLITLSGGDWVLPETGAVILNLFTNSTIPLDGVYTLIDFTGVTSVTNLSVDRFQLESDVEGFLYHLIITDNGPDGRYLQLVVGSAIPEPATYALCAGLMILGAAARRRRNCG